MKGRGEEQRAYRLSSSPSGSASVPGSRSRLRPEEYHGLRSFALGASATPRSVSPGGGPRLVERTGTSMVAVPCCRNRYRSGGEPSATPQVRNRAATHLLQVLEEVDVPGPGRERRGPRGLCCLRFARRLVRPLSRPRDLRIYVVPVFVLPGPRALQPRSLAQEVDSRLRVLHASEVTGDVSGMRIYDVRDVRRASSCPPRRPPAASPPPRPA